MKLKKEKRKEKKHETGSFKNNLQLICHLHKQNCINRSDYLLQYVLMDNGRKSETAIDEKLFFIELRKKLNPHRHFFCAIGNCEWISLSILLWKFRLENVVSDIILSIQNIKLVLHY